MRPIIGRRPPRPLLGTSTPLKFLTSHPSAKGPGLLQTVSSHPPSLPSEPPHRSDRSVELPSEKTLPGALVVRAYDMAKWRYERARAYLILRLVGDRLGPPLVAARVPIEAEVVVPFSEDPARLYQ